MTEHFQVGAAPGAALGQSIDKISGAVTNFLDEQRKRQEKAAAERDAISLFRAAKSGNINSIFDALDKKENADTALDLARVLMAKNQVEYNKELTASKKREEDAERLAAEQFIGEHGYTVLDMVKPEFEISPDTEITEYVPEVGDDGQVIMRNGEPVFKKQTRVIPGSSAPNPIYDVVAKLKAGNAKLTPEIVEALIKQNEAAQRAAISAGRERGVSARAAERSTQAGYKRADVVGQEEQRADNRLDEEDYKHANRMERDRQSYEQRVELSKQKAAQELAQWQLESFADLTEKSTQRNFTERMKQEDHALRRELAGAKSKEDKEDIARTERYKIQGGIRSIMTPKSDGIGGVMEGTGLPKPKALWLTLGTRDQRLVEDYARNMDEDAYYVLLQQMFIGDAEDKDKKQELVRRLTETGFNNELDKAIFQLSKRGLSITRKKFDKFLKDQEGE